MMKERTMPGSAAPRVLKTLCAAILLLAACSNEERTYPEAPDRIEPLTVQANPDVLQPPITLEDAAVSFRVPRGWARLDSTAARRAQRAVRVETDAVRMQPLRTYGEQRTSSFLVVSRLYREHQGTDVPAALRQALAAHKQDFQRLDTLRQKDERTLFDFVIASRSAVHHKVVVESDAAIVQFDYVAPRFQYPRVVSRIEAALAALRLGP
ncbi:MAG: hypothetical protein GVY35_17755 [Bacteroidetes bacterium]|jgi:hypothetical protein|nr:hypothetical protein [Bacteroidota bacterium]